MSLIKENVKANGYAFTMLESVDKDSGIKITIIINNINTYQSQFLGLPGAKEKNI